VKNKKNLIASIVLITVIILSFVSGIFCFSGEMSAYNKAEKKTDSYYIEGTVSSINSTNGISITLTDIIVGQKENNYKIKIYISDNFKYKINDRISLTVSLYSYGMADSKTMYRVLNKLRYYSYASINDIVYIEKADNIFLGVRNKIESILNIGMEEDAKSLSKALLIGDTGGIDTEILQNFRYGGIAHIFSVSGLHIALVAAIMLLLFKKIRINNIIKTIIIMSILFFYSGVCGFSSSSLRASIMCSVFLIIKATGNKPDNLNALFISLIIILLVSPLNLFDVGFQLSFTVTFFIIILNYPFKKLLNFLPEKTASALSVIISATLGSVPIMLINFGYITVLSLITNFIFVPVLSFIFALLFICILFCYILPFYTVLLFLPELFLNAVSGIFMVFDYSNFVISGFKIGGFVFIYYLIMVIISDKINFKKIVKFITVLSLSVIFIMGTILINIPNSNKAKISMFTSGYGYYLIINSGNENVLICDGKGLSSYMLSEKISVIGKNNITAAVILGGDEYSKIKNIESAIDCKYYYVNSDNDINGINAKVINTEIFERGNIKFYYNGVNSLHIDVLNFDILFNIKGNIEENYNVIYDLIIGDTIHENLKNYYENTYTVFYKKTEGFIDAESTCGLLFTVNNGKINIRF
jgi:ComEC/Rec2-related protein